MTSVGHRPDAFLFIFYLNTEKYCQWSLDDIGEKNHLPDTFRRMDNFL